MVSDPDAKKPGVSREAPALNQVLVKLRGLTVNLGGNPILRGMDANFERGQVTALIGLNGAGKTTLLRAILKEVPYTGDILFFCEHDHTKAFPRHIGYVPQKLRIEGNLPLTVFDLFGLSLRRRPIFLGIGRRLRGKVEQMLRSVGVEKLIDRQVDRLSGGELQRVLLALALEPRPELLLLDEPAAGIDFHMQEGFYQLIGELNQTMNITVILVSHDLSMVTKVARHVLCLKDGRIECEGSPQQILGSDFLRRTFGLESGLYVHQPH
ncbi:MAG: metal ABC transporter ATP-binding protein [Gemmataceae bacterium]